MNDRIYDSPYGRPSWSHEAIREPSNRVVRAFCIAIAVFCIVYFGGQELLR